LDASLGGGRLLGRFRGGLLSLAIISFTKPLRATNLVAMESLPWPRTHGFLGGRQIDTVDLETG